MARARGDLIRELEALRGRPLQHAESDYNIVFGVVEWFETLDSAEKECVRTWMGEFAATRPDDTLWRELLIIREIGARSAAVPLEKLCRSIGKSPWRDEMLITLQELGCTAALDLYHDRLHEFEDSWEDYDRQTMMSKDQFLARMIFVDAAEGVRMMALDLSKTAEQLRSYPDALALVIHCYLAAAPHRLVELLSDVARIDPRAALLVRDSLVADMDGSSRTYADSTSLSRLQKKYGAEVQIVYNSIRDWKGV